MSSINGFKIDKFNQHNLPEGAKTSTCPLCSSTRKKKTDKCLAIDWDKGLARCFHCGELIQLHIFQKNGTNNNYQLPNKIKHYRVTDNAINWFKTRDITLDSLIALKVTSGNNWMPKAQKETETIHFNYYLYGKIVNIKFRGANKDFKLYKGAKRIFYNIDNIRAAKECIIVEGELDVLSFVEAGIYNVVSVPNGAKIDRKILNENKPYFKNKEKIFIAVDQDEAGYKLQQKLIEYFDNNCYTINFGEHKDANEYLSAHGKDELAKILDTAIKIDKPEPIEIEPEPGAKMLDFPIEIYPKNIQNYIKECKDVFNDSTDYMGAGLLWGLSVIIGNSIHIQPKFGWLDPAIVWIAIIGSAGKGKTPSLDRVLHPLQAMNDREIQTYNRDVIKHKDYLDNQKDLKKSERDIEGVAEPVTKQFIMEDVTYEAIAPLHEKNPLSLGLYDDELSGWIKSMTRYSNSSALPLWLKSWNGGSLKIGRKVSTSHFVKNPFIPILGGIQPGIFESFYSKDSKDSGHLDRMLLVYPDVKAEYFSDKQLNPATEADYIKFITDMYKIVRSDFITFDEFGNIDPFTAKFDKDAQREYQRVFNWLIDLINSDEQNEYLKSMYPKLQIYLGRFSLLLHFIHKFRMEDDILKLDKNSVLRAEKLIRYFIEMGKKVKFESTDMKTTDEIIKSLGGGASNFEIIKAVFTSNPKLNQTNLAQKLEVSSRTVRKYIKKMREDVIGV